MKVYWAASLLILNWLKVVNYLTKKILITIQQDTGRV